MKKIEKVHEKKRESKTKKRRDISKFYHYSEKIYLGWNWLEIIDFKKYNRVHIYKKNINHITQKWSSTYNRVHIYKKNH